MKNILCFGDSNYRGYVPLDLDIIVIGANDLMLDFIKNFRLLHSEKPSQLKLISLKVSKNLLQVFKLKSKLNNTPYPTQIEKLMQLWQEK